MGDATHKTDELDPGGGGTGDWGGGGLQDRNGSRHFEEAVPTQYNPPKTLPNRGVRGWTGGSGNILSIPLFCYSSFLEWGGCKRGCSTISLPTNQRLPYFTQSVFWRFPQSGWYKTGVPGDLWVTALTDFGGLHRGFLQDPLAPGTEPAIGATASSKTGDLFGSFH